MSRSRRSKCKQGRGCGSCGHRRNGREAARRSWDHADRFAGRSTYQKDGAHPRNFDSHYAGKHHAHVEPGKRSNPY